KNKVHQTDSSSVRQLELLDRDINRFQYRLDDFANIQDVEPLKNYTLVETFAGAGGLSLGLENAGLNSVVDIERDKNACKTLRLNRPKWNIIEEDINIMANSGLK
ncbi:DNA cytosine methyltransferase, partial [Enterococcus faecalis]|uniref:DNA cytosine methyltransferase n=1 Tax=Enterococcus faecalis TaxID=1351 RepID=UPI003EDAFEBE